MTFILPEITVQVGSALFSIGPAASEILFAKAIEVFALTQPEVFFALTV